MQPDNLIRPDAFGSTLHIQYFTTIGKALHVSQHFEKNCKALVNIVDFRQSIKMDSVFLDDTSLKEFSDKIQRRFLGRAINDFSHLAYIPPDLQSILKRATSSRNSIAHDSTFTAIDPFSAEDEIWESLDRLAEDVDNLCAGAAAVCSINHSFTENEPPHLSKHYTDCVMRWVFSDFRNEDFMSKWINEG